MSDAAQQVTNSTAQATLLCVDDEVQILKALQRLFRPLPYRVLTANSGKQALQILEQEMVDVVISDMRMPQMDGAVFLERVADTWPQTVRMLLTGYADLSSAVDAVNKGHIYAYLSKPWNDNELTLAVRRAVKQQALEVLVQRQNQELKQLNEQLEDKVQARTAELRQTMGFLEEANESLKKQYATSVKVFANLMDMRDGGVAEAGKGHSRRVGEQARQLALKMELGAGDVQDTLFAALLHDIGKIALPDALLGRTYKEMSIGERLQFEQHPLIGQTALIGMEYLHGAAALIRSHHERYDGSGYPDKLHGEQIPLGARILAVVNDYDALLTGNFSTLHYSPLEARDFLLGERRRRYDPVVVECFIALLEDVEQQSSGDRSEWCVKSKALKSGMVLARDLITKDGVMLLSKGHVLGDGLIDKIHNAEVAMACELEFYVRRGEQQSGGE
ncbi:MAG: response regulator [Gammaproteobacteria bacterium]|nr:response regulator [Gammaproteobacteria bacterium]